MDYILCSQRSKSSIQSAKTRPGADCSSDHELLIAKFRLKLKKVGKTTRPFRYNLNQIPYDYTVEVTNRLKRLDLIDRVPEELWTEVFSVLRFMGSQRVRHDWVTELNWTEWSNGFPYFLQFKSEFGKKEFMICAILISQSCFCWLYRASPSWLQRI